MHLKAVDENAEGQDSHHDQYTLIKADTYCVKHSRLDVKLPVNMNPGRAYTHVQRVTRQNGRFRHCGSVQCCELIMRRRILG